MHVNLPCVHRLYHNRRHQLQTEIQAKAAYHDPTICAPFQEQVPLVHLSAVPQGAHLELRRPGLHLANGGLDDWRRPRAQMLEAAQRRRDLACAGEGGGGRGGADQRSGRAAENKAVFKELWEDYEVAPLGHTARPADLRRGELAHDLAQPGGKRFDQGRPGLRFEAILGAHQLQSTTETRHKQRHMSEPGECACASKESPPLTCIGLWAKHMAISHPTRIHTHLAHIRKLVRVQRGHALAELVHELVGKYEVVVGPSQGRQLQTASPNAASGHHHKPTARCTVWSR